MANKTVISLDMHCAKCKKFALHSVTKIEGIDSLSINMKDRTLTVIGDADPVEVANLLRKKFKCAKLVSAGPVPPPKAPEKPKEEKKAEPKKEEEKKPDEKKEEKKVEEKKEKKPEEKKEEKKEEEKKEGKKEEKKKEEAVTKTIVISPQPMWYPMCEGQCYPPCLACPNRYPQYYKPCSPSEGFYVWKEESPRDICRIM